MADDAIGRTGRSTQTSLRSESKFSMSPLAGSFSKRQLHCALIRVRSLLLTGICRIHARTVTRVLHLDTVPFVIRVALKKPRMATWR